jgi:hypothetical protein
MKNSEEIKQLCKNNEGKYVYISNEKIEEHTKTNKKITLFT